MTTPPRQSTRLVYPPVNRCIYCGSTNPPLAAEHIIPYSLDGIMELPKASCKACEKITHAFEYTCARRIFGRLRIRHNLPTRRRKERPKELVAFSTNKAGETRAIPLASGEYPTSVFMYKFRDANILHGMPPELNNLDWLPFGIVGDDEMRVFEEKTGGKFTEQVSFHPLEFGRMLAKIGHSYAVAHLGIDAFKPLALDLILGRSDNISHLIGGSYNVDPPEPDAGHLIAIDYIVEPRRRRVLIRVRIRLFASIPTPWYHAVVGEVTGPEHIRVMEQIRNSESVEGPLAQ